MRTLSALAVLCLLGCGPVASAGPGFLPTGENDPAYVRGGSNRGFFHLRSDSSRWWDWGLRSAPLVEPSRSNNGQGRDVYAIAFDNRGRVSTAPVYITWFPRPDGVVGRRLLGLEHGRSTMAEVRARFGRPELVSTVRGERIWYYEVRFHDPFNDRSSSGDH